jgi:hypothetical protein
MTENTQNYQYIQDAELVENEIPAWKMLEKIVHQWVVTRKHEESLQEYQKRKELYA